MRRRDLRLPAGAAEQSRSSGLAYRRPRARVLARGRRVTGRTNADRTFGASRLLRCPGWPAGPTWPCYVRLPAVTAGRVGCCGCGTGRLLIAMIGALADGTGQGNVMRVNI